MERLVVVSGPQQGRVIDIKGALSIGRGPDNLFQLNDLQVSRKHAIIESTPNGAILRDLGSGNGTYVGDRRVRKHALKPGEVIHIGPAALRYESDLPAAEAQETAPQPAIETTQPQQHDSLVRFRQEEDSTLEASSAESIYQTFLEEPGTAATAVELRAAQRRLAALYTASQIISSEQELQKLFDRVMDQIFALVPAHNGVIMLADEESGEPVTAYVKTGSENDEVVISSTIVSRAYRQAEAVLTSDAAGDQRFKDADNARMGMSIIAQNITSAMCVPLSHQGETLGVIYVDTRGTTNAFSQNDLQLLVTLAGPAAIAIRNAQYLAELKQSYQDTLTVLASAIEMRDHYTVGHTWRVTNFAMVIARELKWTEEKLEECEMGGVLHDVGKIAVDDAIIRKPAGLTDEEREKMKVHPERGARLMQDVEMLVPLIPYALHHHERYDGKGYPYGLIGEEISLEGRLIAVADAFDAMTSNRPYRKGMDPDEAIRRVEEAKGTQFDPEIVEALIRCYQDGKIDEILQEYHKGSKSIACPFCSTYIKIPDDAEVGGMMQCNVCHKRVRLSMKNEAYYGELIAGATPLEKATHVGPQTPPAGLSGGPS